MACSIDLREHNIMYINLFPSVFDHALQSQQSNKWLHSISKHTHSKQGYNCCKTEIWLKKDNLISLDQKKKSKP